MLRTGQQVTYYQHSKSGMETISATVAKVGRGWATMTTGEQIAFLDIRI